MLYFYPSYIKKEDAKGLLRNYYKTTPAIIFFSNAAVMIICLVVIYPQLNGLFNQLNLEKPQAFIAAPYLGFVYALGLIAWGIAHLQSPSNDQQISEKLKKFKTGEMIHSRDLFSGRIERNFVLTLAITIIFLIIFIIAPIYSLIENL